MENEEAVTMQFRQPSLTVPVFPTTCVIGPRYCYPNGPINLAITLSSSSSSSSDSFTVKDEYYNTTRFSLSRPNHPFLHLHHRILVDGARNSIVTLYKKKLSVHGRWQVFMGESTETKDLLFTVKRPKIIQRETELHVFLSKNNQKNHWDFKVEENFFQRFWSVHAGAAVTNNNIATLKHGDERAKFNVRVESNVDQAFIIALIAILYENNELNKSEALAWNI